MGAELISNRELITSLQQQLSAQREKNKELSAEKDGLKVVVDEAATAFMEKESEMVELKEKIDELESLKSELTLEKEALDARIRDLEAGARQTEDKLSSQAAATESQAERL